MDHRQPQIKDEAQLTDQKLGEEPARLTSTTSLKDRGRSSKKVRKSGKWNANTHMHETVYVLLL